MSERTERTQRDGNQAKRRIHSKTRQRESVCVVGTEKQRERVCVLWVQINRETEIERKERRGDNL